MKNKINLVVYGTLKKGGALHGRLISIGAEFIKEAKLPGFKMYNVGWYPAIIDDDSGSIHVEVYKIPESSLRVIDSVEGYPHLYQRKETKLGHIYFMEDKNRVSTYKEITDGNWDVEGENR